MASCVNYLEEMVRCLFIVVLVAFVAVAHAFSPKLTRPSAMKVNNIKNRNFNG